MLVWTDYLVVKSAGIMDYECPGKIASSPATPVLANFEIYNDIVYYNGVYWMRTIKTRLNKDRIQVLFAMAFSSFDSMYAMLLSWLPYAELYYADPEGFTTAIMHNTLMRTNELYALLLKEQETPFHDMAALYDSITRCVDALADLHSRLLEYADHPSFIQCQLFNMQEELEYMPSDVDYERLAQLCCLVEDAAFNWLAVNDCRVSYDMPQSQAIRLAYTAFGKIGRG